jgi:hypothetical protein
MAVSLLDIFLPKWPKLGSPAKMFIVNSHHLVWNDHFVWLLEEDKRTNMEGFWSVDMPHDHGSVFDAHPEGGCLMITDDECYPPLHG